MVGFVRAVAGEGNGVGRQDGPGAEAMHHRRLDARRIQPSVIDRRRNRVRQTVTGHRYLPPRPVRYTRPSRTAVYFGRAAMYCDDRVCSSYVRLLRHVHRE